MMKQRNRKPTGKPVAADPQPLRIDPNRDVDRVRYRYLQMSKGDLLDRLPGVEQTYAGLHQQLAQLQFQILELEQRQAEEQRTIHRPSKRKGGKLQDHREILSRAKEAEQTHRKAQELQG